MHWANSFAGSVFILQCSCWVLAGAIATQDSSPYDPGKSIISGSIRHACSEKNCFQICNMNSLKIFTQKITHDNKRGILFNDRMYICTCSADADICQLLTDAHDPCRNWVNWPPRSRFGSKLCLCTAKPASSINYESGGRGDAIFDCNVNSSFVHFGFAQGMPEFLFGQVP